jgi:hypothetical protein
MAEENENKMDSPSGNQKPTDGLRQTISEMEEMLNRTNEILLVQKSAQTIANLFLGTSIIPISFDWLFSGKSIEERKTELVVALQKAKIDPLVFDALLSEEIDRRLKQRFGYAFLFLTFIFTAGSYAIVVLNSIQKWEIPDTAIIALIIETPIQFIGLLYIIARNLFPQSDPKNRKELLAQMRNREANKE